MKTTKRLLASLLAILMTLSCLAVMPAGATEASAVSETASVYDPSVTATLSDAVDGVVYIDSANEFMAFADALSVKGNNFSGKTIKLNCDIVINQGDVSTWTSPVKWNGNGSGWGTRFAGSFDGQGHVISGIYNEGNNNAGLFGRIVGGTEFKNVTIVNSKFISWAGTDGKGFGGLIGSLDPQAAVTTTISNVHIDAIIEAPQGMSHVGGIVGGVANHNNASLVIENCSFNGTINGAAGSTYVGGLVGYMKGVDLSIENCSVDADITCANNGGGFVGRLESCNVRINNSVAQGVVNASSANGSGIYYTSSIIGCIDLWNKGMMAQMSNVLTAVKCEPKNETAIATIRGDANYRVRFDLENIVYDATVQTPAGLVRRDNGNAPTAQVNNSSGVHGTNWYLEGQISKDYFKTTAKTTAELKGGKVFDFWTAVENDYPTPPTTSTPDFYNGTANDTYAINSDAVINIYTAEQLMGVAKAIADGNNFSGKTITLRRDIIINRGDASDWGKNAPAYDWNAFSGTWGNRFAGNFDGQGHVISGIYDKHDTAAGLFGRVTGGNTVQNVSIVNSYFESTGASGDTGAGAIFGFADAYNLGAVTSTIKNVHVEATVVGSSSNVHSTGGLVGRFHNYDSSSVVMENCSFNGTVTGVGNKVGGLIGGLSATNLSITNCSVNADITAEKTAGGLVGRILLGTTLTVSDCLVVSNIAAGNADTTAGLVGYYSTEYGAGTATISDTLISARGENILAEVLGHWGKDGKTLTVTLDNVKYDSNRFNGNKMRDIYSSAGDLLVKNYTASEDFVGMTTAELQGEAIFDGWTAVAGGYPVPAANAIDSLKSFAYKTYGNSTEILGYQTKDNGNGTYTVRLISTLTNALDESYVAAGFKDIKVTLADGQSMTLPVYYCRYAYSSVIGGGETYVASNYLADQFFCLTIDNAPAEIASIEATPFVMLAEEAEAECGAAISWSTGTMAVTDLLTVMSVNVYLDDNADPDGDGPATANDRVNALQAQILAQNPDVICVQEDNWTTKLDNLITTEGYTAVRGKAISRAGWTGVTYESYEYQTIYYKTEKFTLGKTGQKWLSDSPDSQYSDSYGTSDTRPRGINYAELTSTSGETFYVFNVHLENAVPTTRMNQASKLVELVGDIAGDTPVVMCGDFNLISNSSDANDKTTRSTLVAAYDDARIVADLTETHATFINAEGTIFGAEGTTATPTSGTIIDYCFTSKDDFHVYSYDVIAEKQNGIYTSDHLPLVIKLSVK